LPFDAVIHQFNEPDQGDPHDHPFSFTTHILSGGYKEIIYTIHPNGKYSTEYVERKPGTSHKVKATDIHKIVSLPNGPCYTLILPSPWERKPGFWRFEYSGAKFRTWDQPEFN